MCVDAIYAVRCPYPSAFFYFLFFLSYSGIPGHFPVEMLYEINLSCLTVFEMEMLSLQQGRKRFSIFLSILLYMIVCSIFF